MSEQVPNFTVTGFSGGSAAPMRALPPHVEALSLSVCVGASYDPNTNKICFNIPIYGDFCITSPVHVPVGGQVKACAQTCGSFIPTGLKATIYLNGAPITTIVLFGVC